MTNTEERKNFEQRQLQFRETIKAACMEILESDVPASDKVKVLEAMNKLHMI